MKIIDLSQKIYNKMPYHPYDKEPKVEQDKKMADDGYNNTLVSMGMHTGTHIDAPGHLIKNGKGIETYPLSKFVGNGCVIDVSGQKKIYLKEEYRDKIKNNEIVLLYTGFDKYFAEPKYYEKGAPVLDAEFAESLVKNNIKMLGMDLPSPDNYPFEVHKILLSGDILIIENLAGLDKLLTENTFTIFAFPLKIDAEASIARVFAVVDL